MRPGIDNVIIWVTVVAVRPLETPGSPDSSLLRLTGVIEHKIKRGTIEDVELTHVPIEAKGRLAIALSKTVKVSSAQLSG